MRKGQLHVEAKDEPKSPVKQKSVKKAPTAKIQPEQILTEEEKQEQMGMMDSFDMKLVMRLPNTGEDTDSSDDGYAQRVQAADATHKKEPEKMKPKPMHDDKDEEEQLIPVAQAKSPEKPK